MTGWPALVRFLLYAGAAAAASGGPWSLTLALASLIGLTGLGLERRLRSWFDGEVAFFSTLALLTSVSLTSGTVPSSLGHAPLFAAACAAFAWLSANPSPGVLRLTVAAAIAIGPGVLALTRAPWVSLSADNLLVALFGAHGLLYGAPLLWAGFAGLIALRREKPGLARLALAALLPATISLLAGTDRTPEDALFVTSLPFLLPGLAQCFERLRALTIRRPERLLAGAGAILVLWNALFMEQYRRRLLPSDDTVSFAQVTSNSAGLVSRFAGTPFAWPANWIFAWRFRAPLDQWDALADRRLFAGPSSATTSIEFGDDGSLYAPDAPLLLEGFGARRTCERGWCRDLDGAGRLLLPLKDAGEGELTLRLRVRGRGALTLSLNDAVTSVTEMTDSLSDATLRVPSRAFERGTNVLSLSVTGGERATVDRLTLERDLSTGSAR